MSIHTRRLEQTDHDGWRALFGDYIDFCRATVPDEVVEFTWARVMMPSSGLIGLGAVDADGRLIGIALAVLHPSTWSATTYCYLEDLYVSPAARGKGAGRALIEAVYRAADAAGATRTYWVTEEDNAAARRLYDQVATRAPFVQYRREK